MSTNFEGEEPRPGEWLSQAEAARVHGVTRQAIHNLLKSGRLKSRIIGGRTFVSRADLEIFDPRQAGRPRADDTRELDRIKRLLEGCRPGTRSEIFRLLREEFPIHPLEAELGIPAEIALEALARSGPLTRTMFMGVIAEAAFQLHVVEKLEGWASEAFAGNPPYDFVLRDAVGPVRVQIKLQRSKGGRALRADEVARGRKYPSDSYIVETQRTRGGKNPTTGELTRPYRFGDFDILAVSMFPSTRRWDKFQFVVGDWLVPKKADPLSIETFQPVSAGLDEDWCGDFASCTMRFRSGLKKTIRGASGSGDPA